MRAAILSLLLFIAPTGHAQQIHKCVKGSDVSYQSAACDATQRLVKQWDAVPESEPTTAGLSPPKTERRQREAKSTRAGRATSEGRARSSSHAGKRSPINAADKRCNAAKARREAKLASVGLKRTFDLLRKLDDAVHAACKQ
jgi:hypothetical protein